MSSCRVCSSTAVDVSQVPWTVFRHLDFTDVGVTGTVSECRSCGAIAAADCERVADVHCEFLFDAKYVAAAPTAHMVRGANSDDTRPARQAAWIATHLAKVGIPEPAILDVGCFDGALLKELGARQPSARLLAGYDPNPALAAYFPKESPFEFHSTCDSLAGASFDIIMASHSLMYERQLPEAFTSLTEVLAKDGLLIVIMPDILRNAPYLLMGDQYWFGVPEYLTRLLNDRGLSAERGSPEDWGHDLVLLASANSDRQPLEPLPPQFPQVPAILADLQRSAATLAALPEDGPGYHVLGRTANAAFAASVLGAKCIGFVDEAIKVGPRVFRSLPAIHPADLSVETASSGIVICYGDRNDAIHRRIQHYGAPVFRA
jgi:SAM-dependent methyltransferase